MSVALVETPRFDKSTRLNGRRLWPEERVAKQLGVLDPMFAKSDASLVLAYWAHMDGLRIPSKLFVAVLDSNDVCVPERVCPVGLVEQWRWMKDLPSLGLLLDAVRKQKATHPDRILGRRLHRGR